MTTRKKISMLENDGVEFGGNVELDLIPANIPVVQNDFVIDDLESALSELKTCYDQEITYSNDFITKVVFKREDTTKAYELDVTYTSENVTQTVTKEYELDGVTVNRTLTTTYVYTGDNITSINRTIT